MRTVCDVCEGAAATIFCAAEEVALCAQCDEKVHTCNKLASRHIRVKLAEPSAIGRCDICENSPAFFFCVVDGSSLCLECDMIVHVGSKRSHERYLLLRQKIELLGDKLPGDFRDLMLQREDKSDDKAEHNSSSLVYEKRMVEQISENLGRCRVPPISISQLHSNSDRLDIDLNARPNRIQEQVNNSKPST